MCMSDDDRVDDVRDGRTRRGREPVRYRRIRGGRALIDADVSRMPFFIEMIAAEWALLQMTQRLSSNPMMHHDGDEPQ